MCILQPSHCSINLMFQVLSIVFNPFVLSIFGVLVTSVFMPYIMCNCLNVCITTIDNLVYVVFVATFMVSYLLTWSTVYVLCVVG